VKDMSRHRERQGDYDYEAVQAMFSEVGLSDDDFFEMFQAKKTRQKGRHSRNARSLIDEDWEDPEIAEWLDENYDDSDY
jgi:hypothetical protein